MAETIYLDHNATTPPYPEVVDVVSEVMKLCGSNPSSVYGAGREARKRVENARAAVANLANAKTDEVIFTGGGSEADNMAIIGSGRNRVLVGETEHSAVLKTALLRTGNSQLLPVNTEGIELEALEDRLAGSDDPALVCVMAANNETGVLQPVRDAADIAHAHGALILCDAVQAVGKIDVDFAAWDVDYAWLYLLIRLGGLGASGLLLVKEGVPFSSLVTGGGQRGCAGGDRECCRNSRLWSCCRNSQRYLAN